ncbi:hypothetical protein GOQ29_13280 [Clostridium sp. D2Q-14]|uniref:hypothetical protein n=1 Tax=Anaeromonas gelatinilytica TaxID=2683194 RepID=UPI00193B99A1|nr:hypothetical protein [Anaeromonas gelatinilytica]MBS4536591.1 hypothetical protein [Anaeromonas gelatinilytica]
MILLFIILFILCFGLKYLNKDIIYGNVKINDVHASGLEKNEAIDLLKKELKNDILNKEEVKLKYEEYGKSFT